MPAVYYQPPDNAFPSVPPDKMQFAFLLSLKRTPFAALPHIDNRPVDAIIRPSGQGDGDAVIQFNFRRRLGSNQKVS